MSKFKFAKLVGNCEVKSRPGFHIVLNTEYGMESAKKIYNIFMKSKFVFAQKLRRALNHDGSKYLTINVI